MDVVLSDEDREFWEDLDGDGRFLALDLPPGRYRLSLRSRSSARGPTVLADSVATGTTDLVLTVPP
jgi:hypothetical protein